MSCRVWCDVVRVDTSCDETEEVQGTRIHHGRGNQMRPPRKGEVMNESVNR